MLVVEESVVIDKPREEVWDFFLDPANVPAWASNLAEYEHVEGEAGAVGRRCRGVAKVAGRRIEFTDEIVELDRPEHSKLVAPDAMVPYTLEYTFTEEGGGTRVTYRQESESLKGLFKFADAIVLRLYARDVRGNLENAKTLLES